MFWFLFFYKKILQEEKKPIVFIINLFLIFMSPS